MRKIKLAVLALFFVALISCDDDDEGIKSQDHNTNEMMSLMHDMSDEMDAMTMTGDADHDFATMMVMHHQGAINMGNKELEKGDVSELKTLAQTMIQMQQSEIQELEAFISNHNIAPDAEGQEWGMEAEAAMMQMKKEADLQVLTGDTDNDFAALMIQHHQSAVEMAQSLLHHGHHEELKMMASKMVEDQNMEIQ